MKIKTILKRFFLQLLQDCTDEVGKEGFEFFLELWSIGKAFRYLVLSPFIFLSLKAYTETNNFDSLKIDKSTRQLSERLGWSRFQGKWNIEIGGESFQEGVDQGTLMGFVFRPRIQYPLTDQLDFFVDARLQLVTRQIQTRFTDSRQTGITPYEMTVRYRPFDFFELKIGALNMGFFDAPLLISKERSFPGLMESFKWGEGKEYFRLIAQQSVPVYASLESMRREREAVPLFASETLLGSTLFQEIFIFSGQITHFRYQDLPSVVAFESSKMGNTVNGDFPANSRFLFEFDGFMLGGEFCFCYLPSLAFRLGVNQLQNRRAKSNYDRGQELLARLDLGISDLLVSPYFISFFNESDVVPASFNSGTRGHNNRRGEGLGLEVFFRPYHFRLVGEYISSDPINLHPLQQRLNSFQVRLETLNVEF